MFVVWVVEVYQDVGWSNIKGSATHPSVLESLGRWDTARPYCGAYIQHSENITTNMDFGAQKIHWRLFGQIIKISNLNPPAFIKLFCVSAYNIIHWDSASNCFIPNSNFQTRSAEGMKDSSKSKTLLYLW